MLKAPAPLAGRPAALGPWQPAQQQQQPAIRCRAAQQEQQPESTEAQPPALVGEDAAVFDPSQQSLKSWGLFVALLTGVSALLYPVGGRINTQRSLPSFLRGCFGAPRLLLSWSSLAAAP